MTQFHYLLIYLQTNKQTKKQKEKIKFTCTRSCFITRRHEFIFDVNGHLSGEATLQLAFLVSLKLLEELILFFKSIPNLGRVTQGSHKGFLLLKTESVPYALYPGARH